MCTPGVSDANYHKFSDGAAIEKKLNVMLEYVLDVCNIGGSIF